MTRAQPPLVDTYSVLTRICYVGEVIEEGYARKMARLGDPPSPKAICEELSEPKSSVKDKIKELFG